MPREIFAALEILYWLTHDWTGEFDWDEGNNWKPLKRSHSCDQIEAAFEDFIFAGEILAFETENWGERRFAIISQILAKDFRIAFTIRFEKVRYISHGRID
jgi:hypothetical protein